MQRWRIDGRLDGELLGRIELIDDNVGSDDADYAEATTVYDESPEWQEFWPDETDGDEGRTTQVMPTLPEAESGPSARQLWSLAILIALAGVALKAGWYLMFPGAWAWRLGPDGATYLAQATGYLHGAITDPSAGPLAPILREAFPPGYPLFLTALIAPFTDESIRSQNEALLMTIRGAQWALAAGVTLMTFALARRVLFGYTALIPPLLLTISIAWIDMPSLLAYETLLAFLLTASILLVVKLKESSRAPRVAYAILAGIAFSYGIVVQPRIAVVLPFVALWLLRAAPRRWTALFVAVALLAPAAWIVRGELVFHKFVPISINGQASLYLDNVDPIGGAGFVRRAAPPECPRTQLYTGPIRDRFAWASCMQTAGINQIINDPGRAALAVPDRLAALISPWNPTYARGTYASESWDYHYLVPAATRNSPTFKTLDGIALIVWLALYAGLILLGIATLWVEGPGSAARLLAIPLITLPLIHLIWHAENRFRLPIMPLMMIAWTLGALSLLDLRHRRRSKRSS